MKNLRSLLIIMGLISCSISLQAQCPNGWMDVDYSFPMGGPLATVSINFDDANGLFSVMASRKVNGNWEGYTSVEINNNVGSFQVEVYQDTEFKIEDSFCGVYAEVTVFIPRGGGGGPIASGSGYSCMDGKAHFDFTGSDSGYNLFLFHPDDRTGGFYSPVGTTDNNHFDLDLYTADEQFLYYVQPKTTSGGGPYTQVPISHISISRPTITSNPSPEICKNAATVITASGYDEGKYRWYRGGTVIAGQTSSTLNTGELSSTTMFSVTGIFNLCESAAGSVRVVVQNPPPPTLSKNEQCQGPISVSARSPQAASFEWYNVGGLKPGLIPGQSSSTYLAPDNITITARAVTSIGCKSEHSSEMTPRGLYSHGGPTVGYNASCGVFQPTEIEATSLPGRWERFELFSDEACTKMVASQESETGSAKLMAPGEGADKDYWVRIFNVDWNCYSPASQITIPVGRSYSATPTGNYCENNQLRVNLSGGRPGASYNIYELVGGNYLLKASNLPAGDHVLRDYVNGDHYFAEASSGRCPSIKVPIPVRDYYPFPLPALITPESVCKNIGRVTLKAEAHHSSELYLYKLGTSLPVQTNTSGIFDVLINETSTYFVTNRHLECNIETLPSPAKTIMVNDVQPPSNQTLKKCSWDNIVLEDESHTPLKWYDVNNQLIKTASSLLVGQLAVGFYTYKAESVSDQGCISLSKGLFNITVTNSCDNRLNTIETKTFDENDFCYSNAKNYYDHSGQFLQAQRKVFSFSGGTKVLASQDLHDRFNRVVGSTLSAPTPFDNFNYHYGFILNNALLPYQHPEFDNSNTTYNPNAVNNTTSGTLGWYYSANNTLEKNVPVTGFPYSRTEFYSDGTGEIKRSASAGNQHRLGKGHEVLSGIFPVYRELDHYLTTRRNAKVGLPDNQLDNTFKNEGIQSVIRDENGNYAVSIADRSGKVVMSGRKGAAGDFEIINSITSTLDEESPDYRPLTYFYILDDQAITINSNGGASYAIEDIVSGTSYSPGAGGIWKAGFYRIILSNGSISFSYKNYYKDVSYQFYDDAGRLKHSVSPNGFEYLKVDSNQFDQIDKTSYSYNHQGWLLRMTEPDAGTTQYLYRKDGKIRFSQSQLQSENEQGHLSGKGKFSYTNYDAAGRPIESGEYIGSLSFNSQASAVDNDQVYSDNEIKDWIKTHYDYPTQVPNLPSSYKQEFVRGAVSWSENTNIKTWYSYDDLGRVKWMAQKPKMLNKTFLTEYTYYFQGNVEKVFSAAYQDGAVSGPFYHHYQYNADKRLSKAYTSADGSTLKLRASYEYYLHGPLKRIELGDNIQGVDFVYNIQGWLTQINHPDKSQDPGGDSNDAFGMILSYYESSIPGLITASTITPDPSSFHRLTIDMKPMMAMHAPLIRFAPEIEGATLQSDYIRNYSVDRNINNERVWGVKAQQTKQQ